MDGGDHSWVEANGYVYDTTETLMWNKNCYYEKDGVLSCFVVSDEDVRECTEDYLTNPGFTELFVCWIEDLEASLEDNVYRVILREHIDTFKDEIGFGSLVVDQDELNDVRESLASMYNEIAEFKAYNPVVYKRKEVD